MVPSLSKMLIDHAIEKKGFKPFRVPFSLSGIEVCDALLVRQSFFKTEVYCFVDLEAQGSTSFRLGLSELNLILRKIAESYSGSKRLSIFQIGGLKHTLDGRSWMRGNQLQVGNETVGLRVFLIDPSVGLVWSNPNSLSVFFFKRLILKQTHTRQFLKIESTQSDTLETIDQHPNFDLKTSRDPETNASAEIFDFKRSEILKKKSQISRPRLSPYPIQATFLILGILIFIFLFELFFPLPPIFAFLDKKDFLGTNDWTLYTLGAFNITAILENREWHRMFSAMFLHLNLIHIAFNGFALWMVGRLLEPLVGRSMFFILFIFSGFGGALLGLWMHAAEPKMTSIGASGAVMGLFSAALVLTFRMPERARPMVRLGLMQVIIPSLIPLFSYGSGGGIDYAAHFGGAIMGALLGALLLLVWPIERFVLPSRFWFHLIALVAIGIALWSVGQGFLSYAEIIEKIRNAS